MYNQLLVISFLSGISALWLPTAQATCRELQIPIAVSIERFVINTTVNDNWDAAALTFNLTRQDTPSFITGKTPGPVNSTYTIGATLCGTGGPTLVLTHGIIESKLYWRPTFANAENYSFVDAAVSAGYSVLSYDRIGVGSSSKVDPVTDAQFQVETAVLNSLVSFVKSSTNATQVALVGHSYGSYISAASASQIPVDAVVLTGFSGVFNYFGPFVAGAGFRVARLQDSARWGDLASGYLTSSDLYAETYVYFAASHFERHVAHWAYNVGSEPFAVGELPSLLATTVELESITAPVLLLQGQFDVSACGGDCVGVLNVTATKFNASRAVQFVDDLPAGHNLNLHTIAPQAFQLVFEFLKKQGM